MRRWLLLGLVALGGVACNEAEPETPLAVATPQPAPEPEVVAPEVTSVRGRVERRQREGAWVAVTEGDRLAADSAIRTGKDASADLKLGEISLVTVQSESQVGVVEVAQAVQRLKVKRGRLKVSHEAERGRVLRIEGENGEIVEATGADFDVSAQAGGFAVATSRGSVQFEAGGKKVEIAAGKQSFSRAGLAPSAAAPIPTELLLKVARATGGGPDLCAIVEGTAAPGTLVSVDGEPVTLDESGGFQTRVPARAGLRRIHVVTTDAMGRTKAKSVACRASKRPSRKAKDAAIDDLSIQWGSPKD